MKKFLLLCLILLAAGQAGKLCAQTKKSATATENAHKLVFNVKGAQDTIAYLVIHFQNKTYMKDSTRNISNGRIVFEGEGIYDDGLYLLVSQAKVPYLNFIIDKNYFFEYNLDTTGKHETFSVINSPENAELIKFQTKTMLAQQEVKEVQEKLEQAKGTSDTAIYMQKVEDINGGMLTFIDELIARNPDFLFSKMQKAMKAIAIPDAPLDENGEPDYSVQATYYFTHYWDNVDLSDFRMLYVPVFDNMYANYFEKGLFYQPVDTITKYVDMFLEKTSVDTAMFRACLNKVAYTFESSKKILGHDAVFIYIAKNYHLKNRATWLDESTIAKFQKRVNVLEPLLIGKKATELIIADTTGKKFISSHTLPDKYVILWFFDPTCQTCKKESAKMKILYDSLTTAGTRNFEVYAIGSDADESRWIRYVRDNQFPWINVGGHVANVDFLTVYNINETGNPTMFILDENRNIILNKTIEINTIPGFLQENERVQELKKQKK